MGVESEPTRRSRSASSPRSCSAGELDGAVAALVEELSRHSPLALAMAKRVLNTAYDGPLHLGLEVEGLAYGLLRQTSDFREGVEAFGEKRKPEFTGERRGGRTRARAAEPHVRPLRRARTRAERRRGRRASGHGRGRRRRAAGTGCRTSTRSCSTRPTGALRMANPFSACPTAVPRAGGRPAVVRELRVGRVRHLRRAPHRRSNRDDRAATAASRSRVEVRDGRPGRREPGLPLPRSGRPSWWDDIVFT